MIWVGQTYETPDSSFVSLLHQIANVPVHIVSSRVNKNTPACRSPSGILAKWVENLQNNYSPLPRDTTTHVLRLLFPEEDSHRKYDLQEARLSQLLPDCLDTSAFPPISTARLKQWSKQQNSGCLGQEIFALRSSNAEVSHWIFGLKASVNQNVVIHWAKESPGYQHIVGRVGIYLRVFWQDSPRGPFAVATSV